jgi:hypothetical protein
MRADWEECPRGDVMPQYAGLYVTMNPTGDIVMSRVTYQMLGEPKAFLLLFDRTNRRIGLKPTGLHIRNAYPVCVGTRAGGKKLHGHRLTRQYQIDLPQTVLFHDARIDEDGILVLDLRTARISPRSAGHHRNRNKDQTRNEHGANANIAM